MINKKNILLMVVLTLFMLTAVLPASIAKAEGSNPPQQKENFSRWPTFGEGQTWRYLIVDHNWSASVNGALPDGDSTAEITPEKALHLIQNYDPNFDAYYNNIALIGFQGYSPDAQRDIIWNFDMKVDPNAYGTTGFFIEPKDTFASDGAVAKPFDFFGVSYSGQENINAGLNCSSVVNFALASQSQIAGVDPLVWNAYEIRFHFVDNQTVQANISINNTQICQTTIPNYGETELQIWVDNNQVTFDPQSPWGYTLGYGNKTTSQGALFDNIEVKAKPIH